MSAGELPTAAAEAGDPAAAIRVGLFGLFDLPDFGSRMAARIYEHELGKRLPLLALSVHAPLGWNRRLAQQGDRIPEPLGEWSEERGRELASRLDLAVVVAAGQLSRDDTRFAALYDISLAQALKLAPGRFFAPIGGLATAWCGVSVPVDLEPAVAGALRPALRAAAYVSVRDEVSLRRLEAVEPEQEVAVVPDACLAAGELFASEVLERRLRQLRALGAYPPDGRPLVLQGTATMARAAPAIAAALEPMLAGPEAPPVVLLSTTADDEVFARALASALSHRTYAVDSAMAVEDVAAALAYARLLIGESPAATATALGLGTQVVTLGTGGWPTLQPSAGNGEPDPPSAGAPVQLAAVLNRAVSAPPRPLVRSRGLAELRAHFDRLAEIAEHRAATRAPDGAAFLRGRLATLEAEAGLLRRAQQALRERLVCERASFAEAINRMSEETELPARWVAENARLARRWAEELSRQAVATQRAEAAEARLGDLEVRLEGAFVERLRLHEALERAERELRDARYRLAATDAENRQHHALLATRLLRLAMRLQRQLARLRRGRPSCW